MLPTTSTTPCVVNAAKERARMDEAAPSLGLQIEALRGRVAELGENE